MKIERFRSPLALISDFVEIVNWRVARIAFARELLPLKHGRCRFYGDSAFLSKVDQALSLLKDLDKETYDELASSRITYTTSLRGHELWRRVNRRYILNDWMMQSGPEAMVYGIVTYLCSFRKIERINSIYRRFFVYEGQKVWGLKDALDWIEAKGLNHEYADELRSILERGETGGTY